MPKYYAKVEPDLSRKPLWFRLRWRFARIQFAVDFGYSRWEVKKIRPFKAIGNRLYFLDVEGGS